MRILLAACAATLLAAGCQSTRQWTKGEDDTADVYRDDLLQCQGEASMRAAQNLSAMPTGPDKASALVTERALSFKACMEEKGYRRMR